jgi:hypothetical protein
MWIYNEDYNKWYETNNSLSKFDFDYLKQELKLTRLYSKSLNGATYVRTNQMEDIYNILTISQPMNWYISLSASQYSSTAIPFSHPTALTLDNIVDFYDKYLEEYAFSLKNLYTPDKLIKDSSKNFTTVDVATTESLDLSRVNNNLIIDGVKIKNNQRILVKNQTTNVVLSSTVDPETYFICDYEIVENLGATIEYRYYNEENGVYVYTNGVLTKTDDIEEYSNCIYYSVYVNMGESNGSKQYHLSRLKNNYYPTSALNQPVKFEEKHNWILRNQVDYNNLFEINYYDIAKFEQNSFNLDGITYSIPERVISIGEFGVILLTQENKSTIVRNKYKINLRCIVETSKYYWVVGDQLLLLRINKHDLFITKINFNTSNSYYGKFIPSLKSISFYNDIYGVTVGELNTIFITTDGGINWKSISYDMFNEYNYNKVCSNTINNFYVIGDHGVFIEFYNNMSKWIAYKKRISQIEDSYDEYLLVENINDMFKTTIDFWDIESGTISSDKELLFMSTDNGKIISYDMNNSFSAIGNKFIYFDFGKEYGDIKNIVQKGETNSFYFTGKDPETGLDSIFSFDIMDFKTLGIGDTYPNTVTGGTASLECNYYVNKLKDYDGSELIMCSNYSKNGYYTYSSEPMSFTSFDDTFEDTLKSKLLVLDYDIASKLNFFTDEGNYRLPNSVTFSDRTLYISGDGGTPSIGFEPLVRGTCSGTCSEVNWISYWVDSQKTFEYFADTNPFFLDSYSEILISTTFSYSSITSSYIYDNTDITNSYDILSGLMPTLINTTQSRYTSIGSTYSIDYSEASSSDYSIYLYDYLFVYRVQETYPVEVGDVFRIESSFIDCNLVVNKIGNHNSYNYLYMYSNFNGGIINDLISTTQSITINNLNKYSTNTEFIYNFKKHPISNAYDADFVDEYGNSVTEDSGVFEISPKFNNLTSYYNLQTLVNYNSYDFDLVNSTYLFTGGVSPSTYYTYSNFTFNGGVSQNIERIAGESKGIPIDDFGRALITNMNEPMGMDFRDNIDHFYVVDSYNNSIRKYENGDLRRYVGRYQGEGNHIQYSGDGGTRFDCHLYKPNNISVDTENNLYISNRCVEGDEHHVIRKVNSDNSDSKISLFAGTNGVPGSFGGDGGLATAANLNQACDVLSCTGEININIGTVSVLCNKVIYICDRGNNKIRVVAKHSSNYYIDTFIDNVKDPVSITQDNYQNLYVASYYDKKIYSYTQSGSTPDLTFGTGSETWSGDGGLATQAGLGDIKCIKINDDNLYVLSTNVIDGVIYSSIRKISSPLDEYSTIETILKIEGELNSIAVKDGIVLFSGYNDYRIDKLLENMKKSRLESTFPDDVIPIKDDKVILYLSNDVFTYSFVDGITTSVYEILTSLTPSVCAENIYNAINNTLVTDQNYLYSGTYSGLTFSFYSLIDYGSIPNDNWLLSMEFKIPISEVNASMSATMSVRPIEDDRVIINFGTYSNTYIFKNNPTFDYEIGITNSIDACLSNIIHKFDQLDYITHSLTYSIIDESINMIFLTGFGEIPNNNDSYSLIYNLTSTGSFYENTLTMSYTDGFLKFGYSPTYDILDYLHKINSEVFYPDKEYLIMPVYIDIPVGELTDDTIYIDYNGMTYSGSKFSGNTILFGSNLELEWRSLFINTFVDVVLYQKSGSKTTEKLLIMEKYYDSDLDCYVIKFNKRLNFTVLEEIDKIDILSRRTLSQISSDLQELNNIQKSKSKSLSSLKSEISLQYQYEKDTYNNELKSKIPTDSYAKILLCDYDTREHLSGIIYVDYKYELSTNIIKIEKENNIEILNTGNYVGKLYIYCKDKHGLVSGNGVVLEFNGGTGSSEELNPQYFGYHIVEYVNEYDFYIPGMTYGTTPSVGLDPGYVYYIEKDPFLNYTPCDLIDLGIDMKGKISIELNPDNLSLSGNTYNLINIDYDKYRFRLLDGLTIGELSRNYSWLLEADISKAIIGIKGGDIIWYDGVWYYGRWFGGIWYSGIWMMGDWYNGTWNSNIITDKKIYVNVDQKTQNNNKSIWRSGRWYNGTWNGGTWVNGRLYNGLWNNGIWNNGIWNNGIWNNGFFKGGIWVNGLWNNGIFNCDINPAYWLDGQWLGGDFENGMWYNGKWDEKTNTSRFGTKSYNSRTATWHNGSWLNGSFYSSLITENDQPTVSENHKYSIWKTGKWYNGNWYGGISYNMDFKTGTWHGGILEDIQIVGVDTSTNTFILNGIFKFENGDVIYVIDNQENSEYSIYGSNSSPHRYVILNAIEDTPNKTTSIVVSESLEGPSSPIGSLVNTKLRIVSRFAKINWKSGIWTNGIFEDGLWEGGIWYNGIFKGFWL